MRVLRTPRIIAEVTATIWDIVNICPTIPTVYPNVSPISMSRIPAIRLGKYITKVGATREIRINLSEASILIVESLLEFNK
jgi:hypothetical protein